MTARCLTHARWSSHVNAVRPGRAMRDWLVDAMSLTQKLGARGGQFRVQCLRQARGVCLRDEHAIAGLPRRLKVQEREVLLRCDGRPVVFAHTVVPLDASAADWPFFGALGERSLGTTLFGDPRVVRGGLQYARLPAQHPLTRRASRALEGQLFASPLFARRCLYQRNKGVLLVTEVFLPAIADLGSLPLQPHGRHNESTR